MTILEMYKEMFKVFLCIIPFSFMYLLIVKWPVIGILIILLSPFIIKLTVWLMNKLKGAKQ